MGPYREQTTIPRWVWFAGIGTLIAAIGTVLMVLGG
jgi:hypothetical protein